MHDYFILLSGEEKAANEADNHTVPESAKKDDLTEEKHMPPEDEVEDFQENAADSHPCHAAMQKHLPVEKLTERG